jgi:hypothetical protein
MPEIHADVFRQGRQIKESLQIEARVTQGCGPLQLQWLASVGRNLGGDAFFPASPAIFRATSVFPNNNATRMTWAS